MTLAVHKSGMRLLSLQALLSNVKTRLELWRTRRALARLDAHLLKDIGITPKQARHEAELTVWDVPSNWLDR